jgi:hypothetical protein
MQATIQCITFSKHHSQVSLPTSEASFSRAAHHFSSLFEGALPGDLLIGMAGKCALHQEIQVGWGMPSDAFITILDEAMMAHI